MRATQENKDRFVALHLMAEAEAASYVPLTHAVTIVSSRQGILLVLNRRRGWWELPGGLIDGHESPRAAAVRELREETTLGIAPLRWLGVMELDLQPDRCNPTRRIEFGAVFRGPFTGPVPEYESDEIAKVAVWPAHALPATLAPIDACLLACLPPSQDG